MYTFILATIIRSKCVSNTRSHKYIGTGSVTHRLNQKLNVKVWQKNHDLVTWENAYTTSFKYTNIKRYEQMHKVQNPLPVPRSPIMAWSFEDLGET